MTLDGTGQAKCTEGERALGRISAEPVGERIYPS